MRSIAYIRHELFYEPEHREVPLSTFVFDVPYLIIFCVFPPLHLLNEKLMSGGGQGGMSPGATWEPFALQDVEYQELLGAVLNADLELLKLETRFARFPCVVDESLSNIPDRISWVKAVSEKYREGYFRRQEEHARGRNA